MRFPPTFRIYCLLVLCLFVSSPSADDIDIYTSGVLARSKPNILFVLDYSGSMRGDVNPDEPIGRIRIDVLREALSALIDNNLYAINAGVSMYNGFSRGVSWPVTELSVDASLTDSTIAPGIYTNGAMIKEMIYQHQPFGGTATVSAMTEAALYFRGEGVTLGGRDSRDTAAFEPMFWDEVLGEFTGAEFYAPLAASYLPATAFQPGVAQANPAYCQDFSASGGPNFCNGLVTTSCTDVAENTENDAHTECRYDSTDSWAGAEYISPVSDSCEKNFVILISDGEPTVAWSNRELARLIGNPKQCENLSASIFGDTPTGQTEGNCGPELAAFMYDNDSLASVPGSHVTTYTIGFGAPGGGEDYLARIAQDGKGEFFSANNPAELATALDSILDAIVDTGESFASPAVDLDKLNAATENRVFFPLFRPSRRPSWIGNVKGYFLESGNLVDTNGDPATVLDNTTVRFSESAQSFWSTVPDGGDVAAGGVSGQLPTSLRRILTYTGTDVPPGGASLVQTTGLHDFELTNTALTAAMFGLPDASLRRDELIDWLYSQPMGDPLHTRVVKVKYPGREVLFSATNQGLLHAIDASTPIVQGDTSGGEELFAFIPQELLPNLDVLQKNLIGREHVYGLDGPIVVWHDDINNDGIVDIDDNESVMLVLGMRRGGRNYYALDVTNPEQPVLKWILKGGVDTDFMDLAQSWSRPSLIRVQRNGQPAGSVTEENTDRVLLFAGGYDAATLDDRNTALPSAGGVIYMVDRDGNLVWRHSTGMDYSIPSDLEVLDTNADGLADRAYVGDIGGQIWRIDFDDVNDSGGFSVNKFASLANNASGEYQPFFYPPSVATGQNASDPHLRLLIGSGNRDMPLDTGRRYNFFSLKDHDVQTGAPDTATTRITPSELYDATSYDLGSTDTAVADAAKTALSLARGWRIELGVGEKALSRVVAFQGELLASTYAPSTAVASSDGCTVTSSVNRFYRLNVSNGNPTAHLSQATMGGVYTREDRSKVISDSGIASSPVVLFPPGSEKVEILVDKQVVESIDSQVYKVFWHPYK